MKKALLILLAPLLASCTNFSLHAHSIQQGNWIHEEKISEIKAGMSKNEVAEVLGTPVLDHPFDLSRWDYVYTLDETGKKPELKHVIVEFRENRVAAVKRQD